MLTDDIDRRVDRVVRRLLPQLPLSRLYQALREGRIRVNGARVTPATRTRAADLISVDRTLAAAGSAPPPDAGRTAGGGPARERPLRAAARPALTVLYRDAGTLVVNKPAGLAVHGEDDSVTARLAGHPAARGAALSFTPAPVHQLDRITSGALVVALTLAAARSWSAALRAGDVVKLYLALVAGEVRTPPGGAPWEDRLVYDRRTRCARRDARGAPARARVWTVACAAAAPSAQPAATLLLVRLHTGRRHQIRAQAAARGHALLGDGRYAASPHREPEPRDSVDGCTRRGSARGGATAGRGGRRPLLHAAAIGHHASPHAVSVVAPLPAGARQVIERHLGRAAVHLAGAAVARQLARRSPSADARQACGELGHG